MNSVESPNNSQMSSNASKPVKTTKSSGAFVTLKEFHPTGNNITIKNFKQNHGSKLGESGSLLYNNNYLTLKTSNLLTTFGAQTFSGSDDNQNTNGQSQPKQQGAEKFTMNLELPDGSLDVNAFSDFDEAVLQALEVENSITNRIVGMNRTGKRYDRSVFETHYSYTVHKPSKQPEDGSKYSDFIVISFTKEGAFATQVYDADRKLIPVHYDSNNKDEFYISNVITPRSHCTALISPMFWKTNDKFGVKWQIRQVVVHPNPLGFKVGECAIESDPDDNSDPSLPTDDGDAQTAYE